MNKQTESNSTKIVLEDSKKESILNLLLNTRTVAEVMVMAEEDGISREFTIDYIVNYAKKSPTAFTWRGEDLPF